MIVHAIWGLIGSSSYSALSIPSDSPLRNTHSLFWDIRTNDEGAPRPDSFFSLVNTGKIELIAPARAQSYGRDGLVKLEDGRELFASAIVLCTGYESSWKNIFDGVFFFSIRNNIQDCLHYFIDKAAEHLDLSRHAPSPLSSVQTKEFDIEYKSLSSQPSCTGVSCEASKSWASHIYRGVVPAKNLGRRDFALNGAVVRFCYVSCLIWLLMAH
jgi:dimethylaniline monooxygenase (N-oxide forming)